jgi:exopolysaccharide biosynthesis WecB/TagA/CpsF family protein
MSTAVRSVPVLGVPVDDLTLDETVDVIGDLVEAGRAAGRTHQVATVNVDFVVNALGQPDLHEILRRTELAIPDGKPLVWVSALAGTAIRERTAGADLVGALAARAATTGWRILLFGGAPGVADAARERLQERHPGADVLAAEAPMIDADGTTDETTLDRLAELRADIVCVALGNPKQERWIARHRERVGAPVYVGVGGTLDFIVGRTKRAPAWMQRVGLEWLHRALSEPRRLAARYAKDIVVFVPRALLAAVLGRIAVWRAGSAPHDVLTATSPDDETVTVTVRPGSDRDPRRIAALATAVRTARRSGRTARVQGASETLRRRAGVPADVGDLPARASAPDQDAASRPAG